MALPRRAPDTSSATLVHWLGGRLAILPGCPAAQADTMQRHTTGRLPAGILHLPGCSCAILPQARVVIRAKGPPFLNSGRAFYSMYAKANRATGDSPPPVD